MRAADTFKRFTERVVRFHDEVSRLARSSPEGTGAVAGFLASVALSLVMMGVGAYRVAAEKAAEEAKSFASQEHPSQQAAIETAAAVSAPAPAPVEAAPTPRPAAAAVMPPSKLPQIGKAFVERFEGDRLDEDRWYIAHGWANGDWMESVWLRSQISLTHEGLRQTVSRAPEGSVRPMAGGEVQTNATFRYGYFETSMRIPRGAGLISGAFTYVGREKGRAPEEIDIEFLGQATKRVELTIHENNRATHTKIDLPFNAADGFHSYAFDWQPGHVRWYIDGVMVYEVTGQAVANLTRPQKFIASLWATRELRAWAGEIDPSQGPWSLDIACVAYAPKYGGKLLC
ncbi:MAG TPA: family 16 glycosylhydrolase [Hyphomonadaceae bacterium]|nr:family 16 glycosylhydrolase [Hyphomonadaceae bacterium]